MEGQSALPIETPSSPKYPRCPHPLKLRQRHIDRSLPPPPKWGSSSPNGNPCKTLDPPMVPSKVCEQMQPTTKHLKECGIFIMGFEHRSPSDRPYQKRPQAWYFFFLRAHGLQRNWAYLERVASMLESPARPHRKVCAATTRISSLWPYYRGRGWVAWMSVR